MKLASGDLEAHLARGLRPLYAVIAEDVLLGEEALALLRARARAEGCSERVVLTVEGGFDWESLAAAGRSLSLFATRRLLELRIPNGRPGREGAKRLQALAARPPEDTVTVIALPAIDWRARKSAWFAALESSGVLVEARTPPRESLPGWLAARLARNGQQVDTDTLEFLADRVEGNLMAAAQEVEKLALAWPAGRLSAEQVRGAVLDVSRHDPSALGLAIIAGDRERVVRMIDGLRAEGAPLPLVMWGVAQELRRIAGAQEVLARGGGQAAAMREAAAFREREAPVRRALERIDLRRARRGLRLAAEIDRAAKGLGRRDPWVLLTELALRMSAAPAARRSASPARRGGETG